MLFILFKNVGSQLVLLVITFPKKVNFCTINKLWVNHEKQLGKVFFYFKTLYRLKITTQKWL